MNKRRWFINLLKEEKWLNDRLAEGYACQRVRTLGGYVFEPSSRKMVIRLDYQNRMSAAKYEDYKTTYEDFGWTLLKGNRWGSVQYWQKPSDGRDEIFSDAGSLAAFYKRLTQYAASTASLFFIYACVVHKGKIIPALFNIKASYLTDGLWEMEGASFWRAFLFETPFAMFRFLPTWIFAICFVTFLYSYYQYDKQKKKYA